MCAPAWDSDAVFSALIGGAGAYGVTPTERFVWGGYYESRSLIWTSRWITVDGTVESRDALAAPGAPGTAVILRRIRAVDGPARLRAVLDLRAAFGAETMRITRHDDDVWTGRSGALRFRWSGAGSAVRRGRGPIELELTLKPGQSQDLVLEISAGDFADPVVDPMKCWSATELFWRSAVPISRGARPGPETPNTPSPCYAG